MISDENFSKTNLISREGTVRGSSNSVDNEIPVFYYDRDEIAFEKNSMEIDRQYRPNYNNRFSHQIYR